MEDLKSTIYALENKLEFLKKLQQKVEFSKRPEVSTIEYYINALNLTKKIIEDEVKNSDESKGVIRGKIISKLCRLNAPDYLKLDPLEVFELAMTKLKIKTFDDLEE